ncbi:MAG: hypothetical protein ACKVG9_11740, partial [Rhodospirillales bacterium]
NERKQCLNLTYGDAYVGNWNYSTLPILLVWSEGHSILRTILDWGDQHLVTRFNELRKEETARAEKSAEKEKQQVRLKREREERSSFERKESQRSEAANDNIRLALNVLNFTLKADKHSRDGAIAASTQECTFYVFDMFGKQTLYVDNIILNTVQFYSKLIWNDWLEQYQKRHYVEFSGDERVWNENSSGKIFLDIDADLQRVQKAWSLLFSKYCEGASTDEF